MCMSFAADGVALYFGIKGGVITTFKKDMLWLINIHCLAHRCELAVKDSVSRSYFSKTIDDLLIQLYHFFKRSPKKENELRRIADVTNSLIILSPICYDTRWIDHRLQTIRALQQDLHSIQSLFQE